MLQKNGYEVLTAASRREALQVFESQPVDAIVLEYNLGRVDASVFASEIKQLQPHIPIVMLAEHAELTEAALESVDALVSTSDPPYFLWAAVHFALNLRPRPKLRAKTRTKPKKTRAVPASGRVEKECLLRKRGDEVDR
jgi:CheY-like chemotaxis protein